MLRELLSHWGYRPIVAEGEGLNLLENARDKARDFRCQLALVDMRLIDDFDEDDTSGLNLVHELRPTVSLVVSGYGNPRIAIGSIQDKGAVNFVEKDDLPQGLEEKLNREARKNCAQIRKLEITPPEIIDSIASVLFESTTPSEYNDQVADVLAQLFPEASQLHLEKVNAGQQFANFVTAPRPRSVVLKVSEDELQPVIVKFARAKKIEKETQRFTRYIKGRLVGNFIPKMEDSRSLWDLGGIKFSYVGEIDQTFGNFFQSASLESIEKSLTRFFTVTWSEHFKKARDEENISLFELYCSVLDRDWYERVLHFKSSNPADFMKPELWQHIGAIDPIEWLIREIGENKENDASRVAKTRIAVTHGDLHADNLMIDDSQNAWVIDFERSGEGHALQDFIELESDIINRMTNTNDNFRTYYHLCIAVTASQSTGQINTENPILANAEIQKVLKTIATIRSLAEQCTGISDSRQYLLGLFFNTIFRATINTGNLDDIQKKNQHCALMLASILCHRLENWNKPWPPQEWEKF
jgi:ActR/RegA family two-component response regulator